MRKFIKGYLIFCGFYYLAFFGAIGAASVARKVNAEGYKRGLKAQQQEVAGLKLALETLTKKRSPIITGGLEIVPGTPSEPAHPKLVVSNA